MKYRSIGLLSVVLGLGLSALGRADVRPPGGQGPPAVVPGAAVYPLVVKVDPKAQLARLQVPDTVVAPGAAPSDQSNAAPSSTRTMIAGLAMSLALASLVTVRHSSRAKQILAGMIVLAVSLGAIGIAWGDIAPSPGRRPRLPAPPNPDSKIEVEVVAGTGEVTLIVPRGMLERLAKTAGTVEDRPRDRRNDR